MSEMIERVARAIAGAMPPGATVSDIKGRLFMQEARAAIEAMQRPTPDMLEAGEYWIGKHTKPEGGHRMDVNHAYQDMIEVALNGLPPEIGSGIK